MFNSRVKITIFLMEKISFSLKLFFGHFYGQSFIKTVRGPLSATVSTSACETNPESESSSSSGSQSEDEMPVPDARLFSSGKYERRFTWLYYNVAKGGYCCKLCEIFCPFLPAMQVNRFVSGVLLGTHPSRKLRKHDGSKTVISFNRLMVQYSQT